MFELVELIVIKKINFNSFSNWQKCLTREFFTKCIKTKGKSLVVKVQNAQEVRENNLSNLFRVQMSKKIITAFKITKFYQNLITEKPVYKFHAKLSLQWTNRQFYLLSQVNEKVLKKKTQIITPLKNSLASCWKLLTKHRKMWKLINRLQKLILSSSTSDYSVLQAWNFVHLFLVSQKECSWFMNAARSEKQEYRKKWKMHFSIRRALNSLKFVSEFYENNFSRFSFAANALRVADKSFLLFFRFNRLM